VSEVIDVGRREFDPDAIGPGPEVPAHVADHDNAGSGVPLRVFGRPSQGVAVVGQQLGSVYRLVDQSVFVREGSNELRELPSCHARILAQRAWRVCGFFGGVSRLCHGAERCRPMAISEDAPFLDDADVIGKPGVGPGEPDAPLPRRRLGVDDGCPAALPKPEGEAMTCHGRGLAPRRGTARRHELRVPRSPSTLVMGLMSRPLTGDDQTLCACASPSSSPLVYLR
jgi:hypothetical protein